MTTHSITASGAGQSGSLTGGYVTHPHVNTNYMSIPDAAALEVTKLTLVVKVRPTLWHPVTTNQYVVCRMTGGNVFRLMLLATTGALWLGTYDASSVETSLSSAAYLTQSGIADGEWLWFAASKDPDDGAGNRVTRLYWSRDGVTWTQFASSTTAGATVIKTTSSTTLEIGATGAVQTFGGDIGYVAARDGVGAAGAVGGTDVFRMDGTVDLLGVAAAANTFVASTGQTVTVSHSGGTPIVIVPALPGAALAIVMPVSSTGTDTSTGSAAFAVKMPLAATGTGTSSGSATIAVTMPVSSTGIVASIGSATLVWTATFSATGTDASTGTATLTWTATLSTAGTGTSTGSAALTVESTLSATGTGTSTGSATFTTSSPLTATGAGASTGTATLTVSMPLTASGTDTSAGSATLIRALQVTSTGTGQSTGTAALIRSLGLSATGIDTSTGSALLIAALTLTATGAASSTGTATPQMSMPLTATGTGQSAGSAVFYRTIAGGNSTGTGGVTTARSAGTVTANTSTGVTTVNGSTGTIRPLEDLYV